MVEGWKWLGGGEARNRIARLGEKRDIAIVVGGKGGREVGGIVCVSRTGAAGDARTLRW